MIRLVIHGLPAPQGSKTAVRRGDRAIAIEGGSATGRQKHKSWRQAVTAAAVDVPDHQRTLSDKDAVAVALRFWMPKPSSSPKRLWWAKVKPDLDKLVRSTLDGLADGGLLPGGDSRVVSLRVAKFYAAPGTPTGAYVRIAKAADIDAPEVLEVTA